MINEIIIKGAREHNLKDVDVTIPKNKLVVITGLSGSGKSSLAFDTIYAEGQRRYVESLSAYARQFLGIMEKPDVDKIEGLSPAISIDQKSASSNPRSTVGTITEIYDYLRLLFARVGTPHCPKCHQPISSQTIGQIADQILQIPNKTKIMILAPLIIAQKGEHKNTVAEIKKAGFMRVRVDGEIMTVDEPILIDKQKKHTIEIVIDRLEIEQKDNDFRSRLVESLETALNYGNGLVNILQVDKETVKTFSERFACPTCGINLPEIEPRIFSFNNPQGACPGCTGLGTRLEVDEGLLFPNNNLTIAEGGIGPWSKTSNRQNWHIRILETVAKKNGFNLNTPVKDLSPKAIKIILHGTDEKTYLVKNFSPYGKVREFETTFEGVIPSLMRMHRETTSDYIRQDLEKYMTIKPCPVCEGRRLRPESLAVTIEDKNIIDLTQMNVKSLILFFKQLKFDQEKTQIARQILKEINERLGFMYDVGLSYLTLHRSANTLSGGEAQRIRLATQIGSTLTGVMYILDEPSIGLHQRDNGKLIVTLKKLRDLGNSIIVVEHDEETMLEADHLIDIGPGAGKHGGKIIAQGKPSEIKNDPKSLTGQYLSGKKSIAIPSGRRKPTGQFIEIKGASEHNLKNVDIKIPLGQFVCVTGVSGSGKSTLIHKILSRYLTQHFYHSKQKPGKFLEINGVENIDKVITIDQSPIGRTPRSNPATYTGAFTIIRDLFAAVPEAKMRGYKQGRFSFNVKGGRCEHCKGDGSIKIEMHFLPDVYVTCPECHGQRYNQEALEIFYKGKTIADILKMTTEEAVIFFKNIPSLETKLKILVDVGLGYLELGQPANTLSGGEAQRIKLATELARRSTNKTLYILDEPTIGLHYADVDNLLKVLGRLIRKGNTVLVIEHNLDVIKTADYIIDLGPEGGDDGGEIIASGTPEEVAEVKKSYTGHYLAKIFNNK
ncbi:MAG: excinuclease ABC subunit UvrA [Patescibacteria group bacterium]